MGLPLSNKKNEQTEVGNSFINYQIKDNHLSYATKNGFCVCGDSLGILNEFADESIDLVITSPPFALQTQKEYGNESQSDYVDWFLKFGKAVLPKLKQTGSFVVDLGGSYCKGRPVRSLYQYSLLIRMCTELGYNLAEEFFWYNPSKLPSPIEWVNIRKIRIKDSVNTNWWFSKCDFPKANAKRVLVPYSPAMKKLIESKGTYFKPKKRPSDHYINKSFNTDNGGALPSNLLQIANTESNSHYLRYCKKLDIKVHPARFPKQLPEFYIKFLTDPDDLVVDIFSGSNTTGEVAEKLNRKWVSIELSKEYMAASVLRFSESEDEACKRYRSLLSGENLILS